MLRRLAQPQNWKSIFADNRWTAFADGIQAVGFNGVGLVIGFGRLLLVTRNLTLADYGFYTVLAGTMVLIANLLSLGLREYLLISMQAIPELQKLSILKTVWIASFSFALLGIVACIAVYMLLPHAVRAQFAGWAGIDPATWFWFFLSLCLLVVVGVWNSTYYALQWTPKAIRNTFFINHLSTVFLVAFAFSPLGLSIRAMFVASAIAYTIVLVFMASGLPLQAVWRASFSKSFLANGLAYGVPLLPRIAVDKLKPVSDKYLLLALLTADAVALYSVALQLVSVVTSLATAVITALTPRYNWAIKLEDKGEAVTTKAGTYMQVMAAMSFAILLPAAFIMLSFPATLVSLFGDHYDQSASIVRMLAILPIPITVSLILYRPLLARSQTGLLTVLYTVAWLLQLGQGVVYIQFLDWGVAGVAFAATLSWSLLAATLGLLNGRRVSSP